MLKYWIPADGESEKDARTMSHECDGLPYEIGWDYDRYHAGDGQVEWPIEFSYRIDDEEVNTLTLGCKIRKEYFTVYRGTSMG